MNFYYKIKGTQVIKIPAKSLSQAENRLKGLLVGEVIEDGLEVPLEPLEGLLRASSIDDYTYIGESYDGVVAKDFSIPEKQWYTGINWGKLRDQKLDLLILSSESTLDNSLEEKQESIMGIIHLIDHLQDFAVDFEGIEEDRIYPIKSGSNEDS